MYPFAETVIYSRGNLAASSSASMFPSATNSRWNLTGGFFAWAGVSISATFRLVEEGSAASAIFFQFNATSSMGLANFYLGPVGIQASAANSKMKVCTGDGASAVSLTVGFSGYLTGW